LGLEIEREQALNNHLGLDFSLKKALKDYLELKIHLKLALNNYLGPDFDLKKPLIII